MGLGTRLSAAAAVLVAATLPAWAGDIDDLKAQIQALQAKIDRIDARRERQPAPAAAMEAGSKPKSWKLPGTNTSMNIGGFAILQFDYDLDGPSSIPQFTAQVDGTPGARRQGEFDINARQTRLFFTTSTPTDWGDLATNIEFDFNGAGGSAPASGGAEYNSNQGAAPRLRKAYGQLGPVLAGQDTTTFNVPGNGERTDVANAFLGSTLYRLGMVRYTQTFGGTKIQIAAEDPVGVGDSPAVNPGFVASTGNGAPVGPASLAGAQHNATPSFVAQVSHKWANGEVGLSGMVREIAIDNGGGTGSTGQLDASTTSYGLNAGVAWALARHWKIGAQFLWGEGLGIYGGGGLGSGNDHFITAQGNNPGNFSISTVSTVGGSAFVQWQFTDTIRFNLLYGREQYGYDLPKTAIPGPGTTTATSIPDWVDEIFANVMWEPVPQVNIGLQYAYGLASLINGPNAKQSRLELAFRYSF
jgi:hypothetical protein